MLWILNSNGDQWYAAWPRFLYKGIDYETNSSFLLSIVGGFMDYTLPAWNHDGKD